MDKDVMSRAEAAFVLMKMMRRVGGGTVREVEALQVGVRCLVKRHCDYMKNRARRNEKSAESI